MPIYEYQCEQCRKVFSFLVRNVATHQPPTCPGCGHGKMTRALSRFAAHSGKRRAENADVDSATPSGDDMPPGMERLMAEADGIDENDPRAMGRFMRKMAEETGEPMPPEMNEMIRRLEAGEDPESIEADMGDMLDDGPGGGGGSGGDTLYDG